MPVEDSCEEETGIHIISLEHHKYQTLLALLLRKVTYPIYLPFKNERKGSFIINCMWAKSAQSGTWTLSSRVNSRRCHTPAREKGQKEMSLAIMIGHLTM